MTKFPWNGGVGVTAGVPVAEAVAEGVGVAAPIALVENAIVSGRTSNGLSPSRVSL